MCILISKKVLNTHNLSATRHSRFSFFSWRQYANVCLFLLSYTDRARRPWKKKNFHRYPLALYFHKLEFIHSGSFSSCFHFRTWLISFHDNDGQPITYHLPVHLKKIPAIPAPFKKCHSTPWSKKRNTDNKNTQKILTAFEKKSEHCDDNVIPLSNWLRW